MVPKMYVSMQPESLNWETWRVLRNELKVTQKLNKFLLNLIFYCTFPKPFVSPAKSKAKHREIPKKKGAASAKSKRGAAYGRKDKKTSGSKGKRAEDDILDKEHRRLTFAAQMMAFERIHPSSLKLAIDGPDRKSVV